MGALTAYYDYQHGEQPVEIASSADVDALIDRLRAEADWPVLVQLYLQEDVHGQELSIGIDGDRGVVRYSGPDAFEGTYSKGDGPGDGDPLTYFYMGSDTPFPPNAEIPLDRVRNAAIEFLNNGERPRTLEWQLAS
ncbi:Imm1 family immunity protein [Amycolatopsis magusensis]|uniref:Imm1 family immunity protein n=1 Tax=Amycolatopsis magusensis TaxID=882444 RepID=UPI0037A06C13